MTGEPVTQPHPCTCGTTAVGTRRPDPWCPVDHRPPRIPGPHDTFTTDTDADDTD